MECYIRKVEEQEIKVEPLVIRANAGDCIEQRYLYRSGSFAWDVESGMWGIFRVVKQKFSHKCKAIYRKIRECF